jgi:hypothetical protein
MSEPKTDPALPSIVKLLKEHELRPAHFVRPTVGTGITVLFGKDDSHSQASNVMGVVLLELPAHHVTPVHMRTGTEKMYLVKTGTALILAVRQGHLYRSLLGEGDQLIVQANTPHAVMGLPFDSSCTTQVYVVTSTKNNDTVWEPDTSTLCLNLPRQ